MLFKNLIKKIMAKIDKLNIEVARLYPRDGYVIGKMYIDGEYFCDTLEDTDRGLTSDMPLEEIKRIKVYGQTAIPTGTYKVSVQYWAKHKINVPYLHDVPGYSGILIHSGSSNADTLGCILVGKNTAKGRLTNGSQYMHALTRKCADAIRAGIPVRITIRKLY
jgi:hypothetical protein